MYERKYAYDPQFVADLIQIEREEGCVTVGSKLSWPRPLPRRTAASEKAKVASQPRKKRPSPAA